MTIPRPVEEVVAILNKNVAEAQKAADAAQALRKQAYDRAKPILDRFFRNEYTPFKYSPSLFSGEEFEEIVAYKKATEVFDEAIKAEDKAKSEREDYLLHLKETLDKAKKKFSEAQKALTTGKRGRTEQDARLKRNLDDAESKLEKARKDFEASGQIESCVPSLFAIVALC